MSNYQLQITNHPLLIGHLSFDCTRPLREHRINFLSHYCAGIESRCAAHQELIIIGVLVADVSNHSQVHRWRLQRLPGGGAADSTTAPPACACSDSTRLIRRTSWVSRPNRFK